MKSLNLRAYHFGNFYLSSIQQGIQAAHCQTSMALKYRDDPHSLFWKWCKNPTTIILNGGNNQGLHDIKCFFEDCESVYPMSVFHEDQESLGGILTNVGIVIPERVWGLHKLYNDYIGKQGDSCSNDAVAMREFLRRVGDNTIRDFTEMHGMPSIDDIRISGFINSYRLAG